MRIAVLYAVFAAIATGVNLLSQWVVGLAVPGGWSLYAGIAVGTAMGLVTKYLLDRRWIFRFRARTQRHEAMAFALYGVFSVVTTLIFWGFEIGADLLFQTPAAKYTGAVIGLAIGYFAKYWLDRSYTFGPARRAEES